MLPAYRANEANIFGKRRHRVSRYVLMKPSASSRISDWKTTSDCKELAKWFSNRQADLTWLIATWNNVSIGHKSITWQLFKQRRVSDFFFSILPTSVSPFPSHSLQVSLPVSIYPLRCSLNPEKPAAASKKVGSSVLVPSDEGVVWTGCRLGSWRWRRAGALLVAPRVLADEWAVFVELGRILIFVLAQWVGLAVHWLVVRVQRTLAASDVWRLVATIHQKTSRLHCE